MKNTLAFLIACLNLWLRKNRTSSRLLKGYESAKGFTSLSVFFSLLSVNREKMCLVLSTKNEIVNIFLDERAILFLKNSLYPYFELHFIIYDILFIEVI